MNFGNETWAKLQQHGYIRDDIDWIGCKDFYISESWFWTLADNTEYDPGYGRPEIPQDLIIVMKDGSWFERREYDGSEWWAYVTPPRKPQEFRDFAYDKLVPDKFEPENWAPQLKEFYNEVS